LNDNCSEKEPEIQLECTYIENDADNEVKKSGRSGPFIGGHDMEKKEDYCIIPEE
jgi:hypothetical protein